MSFIKKIADKAKSAMASTAQKTQEVLADCKGNVITDHLGEIIIGILVVSALIFAANAAYPTLISGMITDMSDQLSTLFTTASTSTIVPVP